MKSKVLNKFSRVVVWLKMLIHFLIDIYINFLDFGVVKLTIGCVDSCCIDLRSC